MVAKTARHNKIPETGFQFSRAQKQEQLSYVGLVTSSQIAEMIIIRSEEVVIRKAGHFWNVGPFCNPNNGYIGIFPTIIH